MDSRELLLRQAEIIQSLGLPYIYGGQSPLVGFDCSGFIVYLCRAVGLLPRSRDMSATSLWFHFQKQRVTRPVPGGFVFYGQGDQATHVGVILQTERHMLSFAGGDGYTRTRKEAAARNACCLVRPIDYRGDVIGYVDPWKDTTAGER